MEDILYKIANDLENAKIDVKTNEHMSKHSTIKCGGNAALFFEPKTFEELKSIIKILRQFDIKFVILGNGSNTLFKDGCFFGAVICLNKNYQSYKFYNDTKIFVSAGMKLKRISDLLEKACLTGFEFAAYIPACLGGAVYMNAGCFESCMSDIIESVISYDYILDKVYFRKNKECAFSYRYSIFQKNPEIILGAVLNLKKCKLSAIKKNIERVKLMRQSTQPSEPSLGSVFKRNGDIIPAKLIDNCGLKGVSIGGAKVSEKHAGFIVNFKNAAAENITSLIDTVKLKVYNEYKIILEEEIKIVGD